MTNIKYNEDGNVAEFNGKRYVKDKSTGYYLCHDSIGTGSRLHRDVWEYYNCKIPKGYEVHHKDHNKLNNEIENLQLMEKSEHSKLHRKELTDEQREWLRKNLEKNARPAASEWHKSKEGRKWHEKAGKESWEKRKPQKYICSYCGKEFESLNSYSETENKFCSNACKSAYRRKSGIDNVEVTCQQCGKIFMAGKYQKRKFCSRSCSMSATWAKRKQQGD